MNLPHRGRMHSEAVSGFQMSLSTPQTGPAAFRALLGTEVISGWAIASGANPRIKETHPRHAKPLVRTVILILLMLKIT